MRKRVTIRGKRWDLCVEGTPRGTDGFCEAPDKPGKKIVISDRLKGRDRLETILHEGTHAGLWDLDESVVTEISHDLGRILWDLGYRLPDDLK